MPAVESEDSRSGSSSESEDGGGQSPVANRRSHSSSKSRSRSRSRSQSGSRSQSRSGPRSPASGPRSPAGSGPRSPDSHRSKSQSRSRSGSRGSPVANGPKSPSPARSRRSNSGFSSDGSPQRRPQTPTSQGVERRSPDNLPEPSSPVSSRGNSPAVAENYNSRSRSPRRRSNSKGSDSDRSSSRGSRKSRSRSSSSSRSGSEPRRRSRSGNNSDSSISSVDSSSRKNKDIVRGPDVKPEDISDGDMESDTEKKTVGKSQGEKQEINISHEDLSDVSDLEDSLGAHSDDKKESENKSNEEVKKDLNGDENQKRVEKPKNHDASLSGNRPDEVEEQLDFEAEDGECEEVKSKDGDSKEDKDKEDGEENDEEEKKEEKELEEGEVTDEDDARPEETEPRPVCRFFSRGACTWGASCRFLHPGVTDKGNYTMFDMVRPMLPGEFGMGRMMDERMYKPEPPMVESAWERGLRTAKEMLKKSMRRKEQDIDFEEKKMNLSIAQEEFDKENGYYGRIPSPEPRYVRVPEYRPPPEEYYGRRQIVYEQEYPPPRREHPRGYPPHHREMHAPRGPPVDYYPNKYEEEIPPPRSHERPERSDRGERERPERGDRGDRGERERRKGKREVIVQRSEKEDRPTRGDEWQDPWMRSKSPGRRKERKRSYSSGSSSYSSSSSRSSSNSSKSSYRSRSHSNYREQRARSRSKHKPAGRNVSPSVIVSERKAANERAALMNPPAPKRRAPSPGMMRVSSAANPPAPSREDPVKRAHNKFPLAAALARVKGRARRSSRSSSGSSSGSSSDSDSSESSSSSSRSNSPPAKDNRKASEFAKAIDAIKGSGGAEKTKIKLNLKNPPGGRKTEDRQKETKKRPASSPSASESKAKKATSRREELLKQLKAVEDAIAKKRSKV
ncbi:zinc finger CCCH domain-containing protein 18-like isoform X2 [Anthonomus grandis grandis]|uniref:zinc finger CCCH domain-containing protein 18-like isoform X2 n=1 Tax=Anthonomus grandis grandis TaxID=2921223 RepID=UPI002165F070|nr:zinc finger CCCH domain-containing protein 18-like isoform X2 [Anthonomus grandis grandis]